MFWLEGLSVSDILASMDFYLSKQVGRMKGENEDF